MRLITDTENIRKSRIISVEAGVIFFVYTGRNAWHQTWLQRYQIGSMHTNRASAEGFAESLRAIGSSIFIDEKPCILITTRNSKVVITQINAEDPLAQYSYFKSFATRGGKLVAGKSKNIREVARLKIGSPLRYAVGSFGIHSDHWKSTPNSSARVMSFIVPHNTEVESVPTRELLTYRSISYGTKWMLGWRQYQPSCSYLAISKLIDAVKAEKKMRRTAK